MGDIMIKYLENLYLTEKTSKKPDDYIFDIYDDKLFPTVYVIVASFNDNDAFEIYSGKAIKEIDKKDIDIIVLGIAESRDAADSLCETMIMEYIDSKANCSMKEYFLNKLFE